MSVWGHRALVATSALLVVAGFPPLRVAAAPFVAYALLALALERNCLATGAASPFWTGALWGTVCWGGLLPWTWAALAPQPLLGLGAYLSLVGAFALLLGLMCVAIVFLRRDVGLPLALAFPLGWVAFEWLRGHLGPLSFPWLPVAAGLVDWPALLAPTRWFGSSGLAWWLLLPQAWAAGLVARSTPPRLPPRRRLVLLPALVVWMALPVTAARETSTGTQERRVLILQPNLPAFADPTQQSERALAWTRSALAPYGTPEPSVDLVVLPEGTFPVDVVRSPRLVDALTGLSEEVGAPLVFGGWAQGPLVAARRVGNAAFVATSYGLSDDVYHKRRLVPAVEWIPLGIGGKGLTPGEAPGLFELTGWRWGVLICYESIFPAAGRDVVEAGADVILNLTNDAWYGRPGAGRLGLEQHPAHVVLRAVETGRPVVRVANTGPSFVVGPHGRVGRRTPLREATLLEVSVPLGDVGRTLFTRLGDLVGMSSAALTLLLLGAGRASRAGAPRHSNGLEAVDAPH